MNVYSFHHPLGLVFFFILKPCLSFLTHQSHDSGPPESPLRFQCNIIYWVCFVITSTNRGAEFMFSPHSVCLINFDTRCIYRILSPDINHIYQILEWRPAWCCLGLMSLQLAAEFGNIFSVRWGGIKVVVVSGYKLAKEALVTQGDCFLDRPVSPLFDKVFKGNGEIHSLPSPKFLTVNEKHAIRSFL